MVLIGGTQTPASQGQDVVGETRAALTGLISLLDGLPRAVGWQPNDYMSATIELRISLGEVSELLRDLAASPVLDADQQPPDHVDWIIDVGDKTEQLRTAALPAFTAQLGQLLDERTISCDFAQLASRFPIACDDLQGATSRLLALLGNPPTPNGLRPDHQAGERR